MQIFLSGGGNRHADGTRCHSRLILQIFLYKALLLGLAGGVGGYPLGTIFAVTLGPKLAGVRVLPMSILFLSAIVISTASRWLRVSSLPGEPPGLIPAPIPGAINHVENGKRNQ